MAAVAREAGISSLLKFRSMEITFAVDAFGCLDVVVNNAGYGDVAPFDVTSRFSASENSRATPSMSWDRGGSRMGAQRSPQHGG
jgi:hypothetical protein